MKLKKIIIEEATPDGCSGWKSPEDCPHNGKFDPNSPACKECEEDALKAMSEPGCSDEY